MTRDHITNPSVKFAFGIVGFSILLSLVVGAAVVLLSGPVEGDLPNPLTTAMALFTGQGLMALPVFIYFYNKNSPLLRSVRLTAVPLKTIINTIIFGFGLLLIYDEIDRIISKFVTPPEAMFDLSPYLSFDSPLTAITLILTIVLFAPIGEEIVFRGFLQRVLEATWKDPTRAVLVTSMFFAFIHLNPYWLIQIYLWGIVLGYLAFHTGSIIPGILLHGINNGVSLLLNSSNLNIEYFYTWKGHVSPIFILCGLVCIAYGFKNIQSSREGLS